MSHRSRRRLLTSAAGLSTLALAVSGFTISAATAEPTQSTGAQCLSAIAAGPADTARQRAFDAAAQTFGVPEKLLLGVSYMESRWDNHGTSPSTSGGYGPMHLTDVTVPDRATAKGDGSALDLSVSGAFHTLATASTLTGLSSHQLKADPAANICGGAAVLASKHHGTHASQRAGLAAWSGAVEQYAESPAASGAKTFTRHVYTAIKNGHSRVTNDGQRVRLSASPGLAVPSAAAAPSDVQTDCPADLGCEWVPAPYEWYGKPDPGAYGNHDLADRPNDLKIDYIIIHDTEGSYQTALDLVQMPTYLGWNYTIRSSDGHVAQHMKAKDVGWQAGNWYVNMHSIGIEHEGFAAQGATWFTEAMYESSAELVRYLAQKYDIPLDRAHIIGHDQVPGITPAYVRGMHWDPGPYWNWGHYMDLLGAPIQRGHHGTPDVYVVDPSFDSNQQPVTGCGDDAGAPCPEQGTNFVYVHTAPDADSPLVNDIGLHPDGSPSTTYVSDWGARLAAGQKVVVTDRAPGGWLGVWFAGQLGWVDNSPAKLRPAHGATVTVKAGEESAPVYGRAYPEPSAYDPYQIPVQSVVPLQYTIGAGQSYVLADDDIQTDYYYAKSFNCAHLVDDCTDVVGQDAYYEIWFNHRIKYVRAADVVIHRNR